MYTKLIDTFLDVFNHHSSKVSGGLKASGPCKDPPRVDGTGIKPVSAGDGQSGSV